MSRRAGRSRHHAGRHRAPTPPSRAAMATATTARTRTARHACSARDVAIDRLPDAYSLQNFGAVLLAMTTGDGRLLKWDPAAPPGTLATLVTPLCGLNGSAWSLLRRHQRTVRANFRLVHRRHRRADGGSFRRFAWCEQEDFTNWCYAILRRKRDSSTSSPLVRSSARSRRAPARSSSPARKRIARATWERLTSMDLTSSATIARRGARSHGDDDLDGALVQPARPLQLRRDVDSAGSVHGSGVDR